MRRDPYFIAWNVETGTPEHLGSVSRLLQPLAQLSADFTDKIITVREGRECVREERHRLADYFEQVCILPAARGDRPAIRLFFQRKRQAGRAWKDVMGSVLKQASQSREHVWVGLDYRVDDEQASEVAAQVPEWFHRLGSESRTFWSVSATYLLNHTRFTFGDLEGASGISAESLRAMHRNSYRAIKHTSSPNPLWAKWESTLQAHEYTMEPVIRDELLCLTEVGPLPPR